MASQKAIEQLVGKTLYGDITEILSFLHTLVWAIREMAWNARNPDLTARRDFENYVNRLRGEIEDFVRGLP